MFTQKQKISRTAEGERELFSLVHICFPYFEKERTLTMTLIELFDKTPVENILGSLALKPDKVVFITPESRKAIRALPNYQKILNGRGLYPEMRVKSIAKNDLETIVAALYEIISDPVILLGISG